MAAQANIVQEIRLQDISPDDKVIVLLGSAGAGKTVFIEMFSSTSLEEYKPPGRYCPTTTIKAVRQYHGQLQKSFVFLDTPGFDNPSQSDIQVLKLIGDWLTKMKRLRIPLSGIVCLHRVRDIRMACARQISQMVASIATDFAVPSHSIIFVTTMWDKIKEDVGMEREQALQELCWNSMLDQGSVCTRFTATSESAQQIVDIIANNLAIEDTLVTIKEDVIIVLFGPTGSGKSSFLGDITGDYTMVNHSLTSRRNGIQVVRVKHSDRDQGDYVFLDTPGFDSDYTTEWSVLGMIGNWLAQEYGQSRKLDGMICFHRITDNRITDGWMMGMSGRFRHLLEKLFGENYFHKISLLTTMWDDLDDPNQLHAEEALRANFWNQMLSKGSRIVQYRNFTQSPNVAWDIVDQLLRRTNDKVIALVGPTGSGKSSFIGDLTQNYSTVNHNLESTSREIQVVQSIHPFVSDCTTTFIDTPGLDDETSTSDVLEMIKDWLRVNRQRSPQVDGILCFHRITDMRMADNWMYRMATSNLSLLQSLCGETSLRKVTLITTMWDQDVAKEKVFSFEKALKIRYWEAMMLGGAKIARHDKIPDATQRAWHIVDDCLGISSHDKRT